MVKRSGIRPLRKSGFSKESPLHQVRPGTDIHIIPPPPRSIVLDDSPTFIDGPNTEELQDIKNMILVLQLDLQEERCKRECLEEKVRKFEGNQTRKSHKTPERQWELSEMRESKISKNQPCIPALHTTKGVDEKIGDLRSDFDLRLRSMEQSLLEIRSLLANNPVGFLKRDKVSLLEAGQSKDKDYNRFLYKKLERGIFPRHISLENTIRKSVGELLDKP